MTSGNSINANQAGIQYFDGAATWTGIPNPTYVGELLSFSGTSPPNYRSIFKEIYLVDDFIHGASSCALGWATTVASSGTATSGNGNTLSPGLFQLTNGGSTTGKAGVFMVGGPIALGGGAISLQYYMSTSALSTLAQTYTIRFGLADTSSIFGDPTDGLWFSYTDAGATPNWVINQAKGSGTVSATSNLAYPSNTFKRIRIDINAAGTSAQFFVNDVELNVSPLSGSIPTVAMAPFFQFVKSTRTTTITLNCDFFTFYQNLTASR